MSRTISKGNMHTLGYYLGIPKQTEVLLLTLIGICCTIFDASLLDLNSNLRKVWQIALNPDSIPGELQIYLKYMLSGIVLVRTFSVHLYLAFYIVMLWPAIFEERPALLLPWLMVGAIRCLMMGIMALCIGMYTCISYGVYKPACADFVVAQIIDHLPSVYIWCCVVSYYRELKATTAVPSVMKIDFASEITMRRRKVRSMADSIAIKHHCPIDEDRHLISVSTIENVVQQLTTDMHRKATRSLDSLLGVIAAEAEKEELMNLCDDLPAEETGLTIPERTAKLLKLTPADITKAKMKKNFRKDTIFTRSMLDITDIGERQLNVFKARDKCAAMKTDSLRPTRSEKGDLRITDYSWHNTTDFMTNISEVEIGPVLNYSSASVSTQKIELKFLRKKPVIDKKILEPLKIPKLKNEIVVPQTKIPTPRKQEPPPAIKRKKTFDFACQASTLSRNVLRYPKEFLTLHRKVTSKSIKITVARQVAQPESVSKKKASIGGNIGVLSVDKEILGEKSKTSSSFKTDGYTMAYKEKMRLKANKTRDPKH